MREVNITGLTLIAVALLGSSSAASPQLFSSWSSINEDPLLAAEPEALAAYAAILAQWPEAPVDGKYELIEQGSLRPGIWRIQWKADYSEPRGLSRLFDVDITTGALTLLAEGDQRALHDWSAANDATRTPSGPSGGWYDASESWQKRASGTSTAGLQSIYTIPYSMGLMLHPTPRWPPQVRFEGTVIRHDGTVIPPELLGVMDALELAISDAHPRVQEAALRRIAELQKDTPSNTTLTARFQDDQLRALSSADSGVRLAAVTGLLLGDGDARAAASAALCDPSPAVRLETYELLKSELGVSHLESLLTDPLEQLAWQASDQLDEAATDEHRSQQSTLPVCTPKQFVYRFVLASPALATSPIAVSVTTDEGTRPVPIPPSEDWRARVVVPYSGTPQRLTVSLPSQDFSAPLPSTQDAYALFCNDEAPAPTSLSWGDSTITALGEDPSCLASVLPHLHAMSENTQQRWSETLMQLPPEGRTLAMTILVESAPSPADFAVELIKRSGNRSGTCHALVPALIDTGLAGERAVRSWVRGCLGPQERELTQQLIQATADGLLPPETLAALPPDTPGHYTASVRPLLEALLRSPDKDTRDAAKALLHH